MQFFRSQVGRGSREQDLDFDERMMFFKPFSKTRWKRVKSGYTLRPGEVENFRHMTQNHLY